MPYMDKDYTYHLVLLFLSGFKLSRPGSGNPRCTGNATDITNARFAYITVGSQRAHACDVTRVR